MGDAATTLVTIDDALEIAARDHGVTNVHVVRRLTTQEPEPGEKPWIALVQRFGGASVACARGYTFEDAIVQALTDVGVTW